MDEPAILAMATGSVNLSESLIHVRAIGYSFHENRKTRIAVLAIAGEMSGSKIHQEHAVSPVGKLVQVFAELQDGAGGAPEGAAPGGFPGGAPPAPEAEGPTVEEVD